MNKRITLSITAMLLCLTVIFANTMQVEAQAETNYITSNKSALYNTTQSASMQFTYDQYKELWYFENSADYGYTLTNDGNYQVFHVVHEFMPIGYYNSAYDNYDYYLINATNIKRSIGYTTSADDGFEDIYIDVANVNKYMNVYVGGQVYKTDLNYVSAVHDYPSLGNVIIRPVIEFDVVLNIHLRASTENSLVYRLVNLDLSFYNPEDDYMNIQCMTYVSSGENKIVNTIDDLKTNIGTWFTNLTNNLSNWFTEQKTNINTRFSELTSNLTSWYNGMTSTINNRFKELLNQNSEEHEETINGFDNSSGTDANEEISNNLDQISDKESEISDIGIDGVNAFTISEDGFGSYDEQFLTAMRFVATSLQAIFESAGAFNLIITVVFTLIIASMLAGLFRFFN